MNSDIGSGLVSQSPYELDQFAVDHSRIGPLPIERPGGGRYVWEFSQPIPGEGPSDSFKAAHDAWFGDGST